MMKDQDYMQRCLDLAQLGQGAVAPNPMVGCVIVKDGQVIGEGYHQVFGGPHAEVNAVSSVTNPEALKGATVYVSLEPCAHFGKTPPCSNLLIEKQVAKVFIACKDPNPKVAGKGIERLQKAGIEVEIGLLETAAKQLNKRFFVFIKNNVLMLYSSGRKPKTASWIVFETTIKKESIGFPQKNRVHSFTIGAVKK